MTKIPTPAPKAIFGNKDDVKLANDTERSLELAENRSRFDKLFGHGPLSKNPFAAPRRDTLADRQICKEIQHALMVGATVKLTGLRGAGVIKRGIPIYEIKRSEIHDEYQKDRRSYSLNGMAKWTKTFWVPHWDHTGDKLKALAWAMCLHIDGGEAFTLRLGPEVISATDSARLTAYVRDRITAELRIRFKTISQEPPDFCFAIEATELGQIHIHGAATMGAAPEADRKCAVKALRSALKAAGGHWFGPSSRNTGHQVRTSRLTTAIKWIDYSSKWNLGSAKQLGGQVFSASTGMRSAAKDWYHHARLTGEPILPGPAWQDTHLIAL